MAMTCDGEEVWKAYEKNLFVGHYFIDGAEDLLKTLAPRYDLYLASNGTAAVQKSRLASAGIEKYFKGKFISEEMGANKPSLLYFERCFAAVPGFSPETAVIVGDSLTSDIRGGLNAGIRTLWFNPEGHEPREDIRPHGIFGALSELPALLEKL
jgi:2-haloacid dehalogenase